jgi:hypothetical protein
VEEEGEEELAPAVQDPVEEGGGARRGPRVVPTAVTVRSPAKVYPSFSLVNGKQLITNKL